jgi:hypothetical protein
MAANERVSTTKLAAIGLQHHALPGDRIQATLL